MGILMWISYQNGNDVAAFAATQMMYPAAGVILAIIITAGKEKKLPMRFFVTFLVTAALAVLLTAGNVVMPSIMWYAAENVVFVIGSIISWIMLLTEKKEIRDGCNLRFGAHDMKNPYCLSFCFLCCIWPGFSFQDFWMEVSRKLRACLQCLRFGLIW